MAFQCPEIVLKENKQTPRGKENENNEETMDKGLWEEERERREETSPPIGANRGSL